MVVRCFVRQLFLVPPFYLQTCFLDQRNNVLRGLLLNWPFLQTLFLNLYFWFNRGPDIGIFLVDFKQLPEHFIFSTQLFDQDGIRWARVFANHSLERRVHLVNITLLLHHLHRHLKFVLDLTVLEAHFLILLTHRFQPWFEKLDLLFLLP